jgi:hypothetical protein
MSERKLNCCTVMRRTALAAYVGAGIVSVYLLYMTFGIGCVAGGHECPWFLPGWPYQ